MRASVFTVLFSTLLKLITLATFLIGLGFTIFGCVLQQPPTAAVPVAFVVIGVLTMIASVLGYAGSQFKPWLLTAYLVFGALSSTAQLFMVLAIFIAQDKLATAIENEKTGTSIIAPLIKERDREEIVQKLEVGKWVFLWIVLAETGSLAVALAMRLMGRLEGKYENMELEEANRLHDMELQSIGKSMTGSSKVTNKLEDRLAAKMHKKYGSSSGVDFMEGRRWYNFWR